jgi:predicted NBD/HSP70 family sugar kinase
MYLGVDIGGTKTLVATLGDDGEIQEERRFSTPKHYPDFLAKLKGALVTLATQDFTAVGVGVPGRLDRETGVAISCGNLGWKNIAIRSDIHKLVHCPVVIENDAKLAGLSEAKLLGSTYKKVLYITISTGIGIARIENGVIDTSFGDSGGKAMLLQHNGKEQPWESFASGKAIVKRFGKRAEDIHDAKTWQIIAHDLAQGLIDLIAIVEPEVIVFGGGVGQFLERFEKPLKTELKRYENPMLPIPPLRKAARPEQAVIYGCYDVAKANHG